MSKGLPRRCDKRPFSSVLLSQSPLSSLLQPRELTPSSHPYIHHLRPKPFDRGINLPFSCVPYWLP